ncbi:MAG TPA: DUF6438 domain-containing protein [Pyrinomonadaceae bacterium]|nr:DUF6438 domain-containing protein [Pyrinomonadaceae bacterium]
MRRSITAMLIAVAVLGCLMPALSQAGASSARRREKVITLERTACFGTCPMYKLAIYSDGRVEYEGLQFVKKVGKATSRISRAKLEDLVMQFTNIYYFNLPDSIEPGTKSCPQPWTDMPSAITSLTWQGRSKTVKHYHGCRGLSGIERLTDLEKEIDRVVNVKQWTGK